jgi:hypothetical protein
VGSLSAEATLAWLTAVLAVATVVLAVATIVYAKRTTEMVQEMRLVRRGAVHARVVPTLHFWPGGNAALRIFNAGPAHALDLDVEFTLEPGGPRRRLALPILPVGEGYNFHPSPQEEPNALFRLEHLAAKYQTFHLTGGYGDIAGERHTIDEALNLREVSERLNAAFWIPPKDWNEESAKALTALEIQVAKLAAK